MHSGTSVYCNVSTIYNYNDIIVHSQLIQLMLLKLNEYHERKNNNQTLTPQEQLNNRNINAIEPGCTISNDPKSVETAGE